MRHIQSNDTKEQKKKSQNKLFKNGVYIFNSIESLRHMKSFESVSESVVTKVLKTLLQSEVKPINLHCKDGYFYLMDLEHILEEFASFIE